MTASDYVESTLYHQREQAMILHNERRRRADERARASGRAAGRQGSGTRVGALRERLHTFLNRTPVRG